VGQDNHHLVRTAVWQGGKLAAKGRGVLLQGGGNYNLDPGHSREYREEFMGAEAGWSFMWCGSGAHHTGVVKAAIPNAARDSAVKEVGGTRESGALSVGQLKSNMASPGWASAASRAATEW
jgi:hypothetical protein